MLFSIPQNQKKHFMENPFEILSDKLDRIEIMLSELKRNISQASGDSPLPIEILNTDQAAKFPSIAKPTLYGYTSHSKIPCYKTGKRIYFKKSELLEWISKNKVKTTEEIEQEVSNLLLRKRRK